MLPAPYNVSLDTSTHTLAEAFQDLGYATFFAGKWHLGGEGSLPTDHGFDINVGGWEVGSPRGGFFSPWENPYLPNQKKGENLSNRLSKETVSFMASSEPPFFAFLSFYAVHGPIQTSEVKWRKYRNKADSLGIAESGYEMERVLPIRTQQDNPVYAGLVEQMDEAIGLVLDGLDSLGLAENTVVVFTSDNGGVASGDAFSTSNLPFRGGKGYQWEGGIREPFIIKVPWMKTQKNYHGPVTGADVYPTLTSLAGGASVKGGQFDGINLEPALLGQSLPERTLFWHYPHYGNQGGEPSSIIRKGKWKLIHYYEASEYELYDLETDPSEQNDVALQLKVLASSLDNELMSYLDSVDARKPVLDSLFDTDLAVKMRKEKEEVLLLRLEMQRRHFLSTNYDPGNNWWGSTVED